MKKKIKNSLLATGFLILFITCKPTISEKTIDNYISEINFYENTLKEKTISKEDLLKELDSNHKQLIANIDPTKKTAFEKDFILHSELENKKTCIIEFAEKNYTNSILTNAIIESGNLFIKSVTEGKIEEKEANIQWEKLVLDLSNLQQEADSIEMILTESKLQIYELHQTALKKYGMSLKK
ncbi:MAG: hypothetical protein JNM51_17705 [Bacteroidia bacterium]|nr:hypothetical protein [Bacteroidia bacterium]